MPADEVSTGSDVDAARVRTTGPRHAAPKKPLFTRFHVPAGKAIALAAMPTAVLMGMGFTPTLANADDQPASKSLTIDEYKDCVAALEGADASASASPSPSASDSASEDAGSSKGDSKDESTDGSKGGSKDTSGDSGDKGGSSSSDSGSGDAAEPSPSASSSPAKSATSGDTATASPSATETSKSVLETVGDAITDLFDGKDADSTATASPSPSASGSASAGDSSSGSGSGSSDPSGSSGSGTSGKDSSGTSKGTKDAVTDKVKDTAETAGETAKDAGKATGDATASPSPSESATTNADDCPVATDDEGGIDNKIRLPDDPWYLNASSLLLKGADYQGVVKVKTANGTVKEVLKYVISDGTDIGDLHQTVNDKQSGRTYHVQAGKGTTSTIRDGDTIMYTESISGNLFGLIPITFSPKSPPPLNIPLIYFTNVKVQQAGQFGGTLTVPGLHQYTTAG